ncbi:hypothetical protein J3R83DRAFT_5982, partial [Lanmaoa asiatica]
RGYPREERTWEPKSHLSHATKEVESFHRKHPEAVRAVVAAASRAPAEPCDCSPCVHHTPLFSDLGFKSLAASLNRLPDSLFEIPLPGSDPI